MEDFYEKALTSELCKEEKKCTLTVMGCELENGRNGFGEARRSLQ